MRTPPSPVAPRHTSHTRRVLSIELDHVFGYDKLLHGAPAMRLRVDACLTHIIFLPPRVVCVLCLSTGYDGEDETNGS